MNIAQKELLRQLSKSSPDYFEVTEGDHPHLVKVLNTLLQGEYL